MFGILIGATALGGLSDRFGRKAVFIAELALFIGFLVLVTVSPNFTVLLIGLFGMGMALGCDYPTAHVIISESIPSSSRGRLVLSAFAFQAVGALAGTGVGLLILESNASIGDWGWMYATAIVPAMAVLAGRFFVPQSGHWLVVERRVAEAERELEILLRRQPPYPRKVVLATPPADVAGEGAREAGFASLFSKKYRRATLLAAVP